jgi:pilus assembly protein Flp/PilA
MEKIQQSFANFLRDESGQDLIEYALIAAVIALAAVAAMSKLGSGIGNEFNSIGSDL